ncbi:hypothetical protein HDU81_003880 [Chytriomyces hyalinus]|nr:hypothetical protein HDU81_003880 [Chytriomyces hyalinus]
MTDSAPPPHVGGPNSNNNAKLYVGRLPRNAEKRDLEDLFGKYGRVLSLDVKQGGFAFVEYEDSRDAEDAIAALNNFPFEGERISVEWSRRSANSSSSTCFICGQAGHWARECPDNREQGMDVRSGKCFKCGQPGHLARFCREGGGGGGRGRSRSPGYDRGYDRGYGRRGGDPYYRGGPPRGRYDDYRRSPERGYPPRREYYDDYDRRYDDRRDFRGPPPDRDYRDRGYPPARGYDDRDPYYRGGPPAGEPYGARGGAASPGGAASVGGSRAPGSPGAPAREYESPLAAGGAPSDRI